MTMAMAIVTSHEAFNELGLGIEAVNHPASFEGLLLKISSYFVVPFIIKENIYIGFGCDLLMRVLSLVFPPYYYDRVYKVTILLTLLINYFLKAYTPW